METQKIAVILWSYNSIPAGIYGMSIELHFILSCLLFSVFDCLFNHAFPQEVYVWIYDMYTIAEVLHWAF